MGILRIRFRLCSFRAKTDNACAGLIHDVIFSSVSGGIDSTDPPELLLRICLHIWIGFLLPTTVVTITFTTSGLRKTILAIRSLPGGPTVLIPTSRSTATISSPPWHILFGVYTGNCVMRILPLIISSYLIRPSKIFENNLPTKHVILFRGE
ncbi:hypothetical protein EDC94DRAFT_586095 [Helicostylum pulchrum]|nr:hypothetical protein EDC94DRAFT_586095 [Helicostylum pulchrum]